MSEYIDIQLESKTIQVPNSWYTMAEEQFIPLMDDIVSMASGVKSVGRVRLNYILRYLGIDYKINDDDACANLALIAEKVTFPFLISYPDNDSALEGLDSLSYEQCKKVAPHRLTGISIANYLKRLDYRYTLDLCFLRQFIPSLKVNGRKCTGYRIDTDYDMFTTSLTALQFIEARECMEGEGKLPLLAAILYSSHPYDSAKAHETVGNFEKLDKSMLYAIAFNFRAIVNYLFTKTDYKLLTAAKPGAQKSITTGAMESLYNLSSDGYGNITEVENMNLLQYLGILRKKVIDSVRQLHAAKMENVKIEEETGLPLDIIKSII